MAAKSPGLVQRFPIRTDAGIVHKTWPVDLVRAHQLSRFSGRTPVRLKREVEDMATHMPRWVLTVVRNRNRLLCKSCGGMLVFDRGLRCVQCEKPLSPSRVSQDTRLGWFGLLPPIGIDNLGRIKKSLLARSPAHHAVGRDPQLGNYLLVPLVAIYPGGFPTQPVQVAYLPSFFSIKGMPKNATSHAYHLYGQATMCLYAHGEWNRETTCREVIQQRAYAHVIKLLNYGAGKSRAFDKVS